VVDNIKQWMPDDAMYLSGPPLHVIASTLLATLADALPGRLDMAATVLHLAGIGVPENWWSGQSAKGTLLAGNESGRQALFLSQGAWSCQRGVRWGDNLYLRTFHDGYHPHWNPDMLFNLADDPHETKDMSDSHPEMVSQTASMLKQWTAEQVEISLGDLGDPMDTVLAEGGPYHVRGHLPANLDRLRQTGRSEWADVLVDRHPVVRLKHRAGP